MEKRQQSLFETEPEPWELDDVEHRWTASVVFSGKPYGPYDYLVPDKFLKQAEPGRRVRVPLGRGNRTMVGYCVSLENRPAVGRRLKAISAVVDSHCLASPELIRLAQWMAEKYLCSWGQALDAVAPAGVRQLAGTREASFLSVPTHVAARITQLKLPEKQSKALCVLASSPLPLTPPQLAAAAGCTIGPINQLRKKNLVEVDVRRIDSGELEQAAIEREQPLQLNEDQQAALGRILQSLRNGSRETFLMHGVTASGKTEVYIQAIEEVVQYGKQAIVLVPEISLTPQTKRRFLCRFDQVAVLHSHLSDADRHRQWRRIASGEVQVVVGARSAVFAPTPKLGLIVLDEEHDSSFKQDSAPRYHARDVALYRSRMEQVPLILGSATPALESWRLAQTGQSVLLEMPRRISNLPLPAVAAIDLRNEFRNRRGRGAVSRPLHQAIDRALKEGGQVILLLNRRGFATTIQCPSCGHVVQCPSCEVSLTHHQVGDKQVGDKAICHYCDYEIDSPDDCPECGFEDIRLSGLGTQRLENEIQRRFRNVSCLRMDSDAMRRPGSHEEALARFRAGEVRILLGTQMIAKGLDFPNVTLVGVINADTALHFPDFRAGERTFQLVTQVAGRTGRGEKGGRVLVQTFSPEHPAIQAAMRHDYAAMAAHELPIRREFGYPPFGEMIRIIIRSELEPSAEQFAQHVADYLEERIEQLGQGARILGPAEAPIAKVRGKYRFHLLLQSAEGSALREVVRRALEEIKTPENVQWIADVDPIDLL